jgi:hypothetical protein
VALLSRARIRTLLRYAGIAVVSTVVLLAIAIFVTLRIDLGPSIRALAEREGSKQIQRPLHVGRLSFAWRVGESK